MNPSLSEDWATPEQPQLVRLAGAASWLANTVVARIAAGSVAITRLVHDASARAQLRGDCRGGTDTRYRVAGSSSVAGILAGTRLASVAEGASSRARVGSGRARGTCRVAGRARIGSWSARLTRTAAGRVRKGSGQASGAEGAASSTRERTGRTVATRWAASAAGVSTRRTSSASDAASSG